MFILSTITKWESLRDGRHRVGALDLPTGREFVINPNRLVDIRDKGTGSKFLFFDNHLDSRENASYVESSDSVTTLQEAYDDDLSSKFIELPIYRDNNISRATDIVRIDSELFAYADANNASPGTSSWVVYIKNGFKRVEVLVNLTLNDIIYYTSGDMKFFSTINLVAGVETGYATTIPSTKEIYNVYLEDSSGNDITSGVTIRVAVSGGVWVVYIYSTDALTNVKLKILY
jgi:hypothetical protein